MKHPYPFNSNPTRRWFVATLAALTLSGAMLAAPAQAQTVKVEAESGVLTGTAALANTIMPYSGTGYVTFGQTGDLTLTVNVATAGLYDLTVQYEAEFGTKLLDLRVNGTAADPNQTLYLNSTMSSGGFLSTTPSRYALTAGANTVVFTASYGFHGIDYVQVVKAPATVTPLMPSATGRVEAEAGIVSGAQAYLRDGGSGQSGSLFVGNFFVPGDNVSLAVNVATAGQYQIAVGARQEFNGKAYTIAVNGGAATTVNIPNSLTSRAATAPFGATAAGTYTLTAGTSTIVIGGQGGYFDIDYINLNRALAVKPSNGLSSISAFPNPAADGQFSVALQATVRQEAQVVLLNALGQRVRTFAQPLQAGPNQFAVSTAGLSNGIYQLVVYINQQASATQRVAVAN